MKINKYNNNNKIKLKYIKKEGKKRREKKGRVVAQRGRHLTVNGDVYSSNPGVNSQRQGNVLRVQAGARALDVHHSKDRTEVLSVLGRTCFTVSFPHLVHEGGWVPEDAEFKVLVCC